MAAGRGLAPRRRVHAFAGMFWKDGSANGLTKVQVPPVVEGAYPAGHVVPASPSRGAEPASLASTWDAPSWSSVTKGAGGVASSSPPGHPTSRPVNGTRTIGRADHARTFRIVSDTLPPPSATTAPRRADGDAEEERPRCIGPAVRRRRGAATARVAGALLLGDDRLVGALARAIAVLFRRFAVRRRHRIDARLVRGRLLFHGG